VLAQRANLLASWEAAGDAALDALQGRAAGYVPYLVVAGLGVIALALLVEALAVVRSVAARRSAFAFNALFQVALAALLLVGVNLLSAGYDLPVPGFLRGALGERLTSPGYHVALDWTRGGQFTLPEPTRERLAKLRDKTTILVYVQHKTFGALSA